MSAPAPRPLPTPGELSAPFWEGTRRGEFRIQRCRACGTAIFYPRHNCTHCGSRDLEWQPSSGRGEVYTYTVARRPTHPAFADRVPYVIAIVQLDEGPHVTTNVVDCDPDAVHIGMRVEVSFEPERDAIALPVFRPSQLG